MLIACLLVCVHWCLQALQEMRKLRVEKTAEVKEFRLRLEHLKTHKDHSTKLKSDIAEGQEKDRNYMTQINGFEQEVKVSFHTSLNRPGKQCVS